MKYLFGQIKKLYEVTVNEKKKKKGTIYRTIFLTEIKGERMVLAVKSFSGVSCYKVSFSGDIQDPPGQGPVQPAVGDPASAGGLD